MIKSTKIIALLSISLLLFSVSSISAQVRNTKSMEWKKNTISGGIGNAVFVFTATGYYERILKQKNKVTYFAKVGAGGYQVLAGSGDNGRYILAQFGILTGTEKHHLELGVGPLWDVEDKFSDMPPITASIGWRKQSPGSRLMIRAGVSWPEIVYMGLGFSF